MLRALSSDMVAYYTVETSNIRPVGAPVDGLKILTETTLFVPQWDGSPSDVVCFVGSGSNFEPNIQSVYGGGGMECNASNGCGVHIHSGFGCEDSTAQGGHWYDSATLDVDPWIQVGYKRTDDVGDGEFTACVQVGYDVKSDPSLLEGRAFVVHNPDGSRASCGLMTAKVDPVTASPTKAPKSGKTTKSGKNERKFR